MVAKLLRAACCPQRIGMVFAPLGRMPRGSKKSYTTKQRRQAKHIEDSEVKSGKSAKVAARIAYASVNRQDGGGKQSGSGRGTGKHDTTPSKNGGRKGGKARAKKTTSAKRAAGTRKPAKRTAAKRKPAKRATAKRSTARRSPKR